MVSVEYIAEQRALGWPDIHPEDYCHKCGVAFESWFTDRTTWLVATAAWAAETRREGICSNAFAAHDIPSPSGVGWHKVRSREWVCEVWQSAYGHRARKRTWLFFVGDSPPSLDWSRKPGTAQVGWFDRIKPTLSKREASATPIPFRDLLLSIARSCSRTEGSVTSARLHLSRYYLSARSRGCDLRGSLHYAIDRSNRALIQSFTAR